MGVDNKLAKKFENNVGMELPELPKEMPPLTEMVASYMVRLTNLSTRVFYVLKFLLGPKKYQKIARMYDHTGLSMKCTLIKTDLF